VLLTRLPVGCAPRPTWTAPKRRLADFFQYLSSGEYKKAAALYGGGYDGLQSLNPSLPLHGRSCRALAVRLAR
jgi:hypothetical protein